MPEGGPIPEARLLQELQWSDNYREKAFSVGLERRSGRLYLMVRGKLFTPPPPLFFTRLCAFLRDCSDVRLCVELSGCEYLASPFYGMLAEVAVTAHRKGMAVALVNPGQKVYSTLCQLGFGRLFEVVEEHTVASPSQRLRSERRYRNLGEPGKDGRDQGPYIEPFS